MDETYIKIKGKWTYLYREVGSKDRTVDFLLSKKRDTRTTKRFFRNALKQKHNQKLGVITTDKYAATELAIKRMKELQDVKHRNIKYLNNTVESDHKITKQISGFKSFQSTSNTVCLQ